jgi:hypothetical protein
MGMRQDLQNLTLAVRDGQWGGGGNHNGILHYGKIIRETEH